VIDLKDLDSDLKSAGCDDPLRLAFLVFAKHVNAGLEAARGEPRSETGAPTWVWDRKRARWAGAGEWCDGKDPIVRKYGREPWRAYVSGMFVGSYDTSGEAMTACEVRVTRINTGEPRSAVPEQP
jgi:hypothetical protein